MQRSNTLMPSFEELQSFCYDSYPITVRDLPIEWEYILVENQQRFIDDKTGFGASAYLCKSTNEIIIAYRGTKPNSIGDLQNDLNLATSFTPSQYEFAKTYLKGIQNQLSSEEHKIFITGHSLGGGLAQLIGAYAHLPTVTFNGVGMDQLLNNANLMGEVIPPPNGIFKNITNYVIATDVVGNAYEHLGLTIYSPGPPKLPSKNPLSVLLSDLNYYCLYSHMYILDASKESDFASNEPSSDGRHIRALVASKGEAVLEHIVDFVDFANKQSKECLGFSPLQMAEKFLKIS